MPTMRIWRRRKPEPAAREQVDTWLKWLEIEALSPHTIDGYRATMRKFLDRWPELALSQFTDERECVRCGSGGGPQPCVDEDGLCCLCRENLSAAYDSDLPAGASIGTAKPTDLTSSPAAATTFEEARREAEEWLDHFRESANPQTAEERWEYLDQAAVHIEKLVNDGAMFDA